MTEAYISLLIGDGYLPGALYLANRIRQFDNERDLVILVSDISIKVHRLLERFYSKVVVLLPDSKIATSPYNAPELHLLNRPDLENVLNKIHIFHQTHYEKLLYVDLDVLILNDFKGLFDIEVKEWELYAVSDIGWPDYFNSGLMLFKPSANVFRHLLALLTEVPGVSYDGGDQGLINYVFQNKWLRTGDDTKRCGVWYNLSFAFNMTLSNNYESLPSVLRNLTDIKLVHFIGIVKPWMLKPSFVNDFPDGSLDSFVAQWWEQFSSFENGEFLPLVFKNVESERIEEDSHETEEKVDEEVSISEPQDETTDFKYQFGHHSFEEPAPVLDYSTEGEAWKLNEEQLTNQWDVDAPAEPLPVPVEEDEREETKAEAELEELLPDIVQPEPPAPHVFPWEAYNEKPTRVFHDYR
ncbi:Glycogenin glucosyltransferase [Komagataella phaffii CBS 7435]|uniref:Glycogenin n=2 Tax=Komagataella phaffii TaxID=460519 RepID=GLG_KOMPG|nr:Self-glucosylating initiator of glycogen synthesis, also glucosylates n-dodecyl-beta-D-maltoside [Komagataella phaffii GS115]AOA64676.1 GQ67_05240T0 [Komagataella phaffii]CAH2450473.1 Glycogenin glucosyltransferase [Komagataella phaffii CBS 7435]AOA69459.1 GQ68_05222T0 [Komagataella phaffii GS115]CAY72116.1 Self-glucosylating initiator of glycogen synthesis, also glucosylates n-dodecyl-beta-D-maltoside [Komagataella phaffii GS115]CCA40280.1 Glycogenin glucosyltransferase [Komagataella phaff